MKQRFSYIFFCVLLSNFIVGQTDSVAVPMFLDLPDAVYLNYTDFRHNKGILKEQITFNGNKEQLDFVGKSLDNDVFQYEESAKTNSVASTSIWGYIQNKTLYINYKSNFYRVPVFGSICYLVATVETVGVGYYDPMFGPTPSGRRQEVREFLINFYDGKVDEFRMDDAKALISRDKFIYEAFSKLSSRKQKDQIFRYIRKYNEAHPVYFLK